MRVKQEFVSLVYGVFTPNETDYQPGQTKVRHLDAAPPVQEDILGFYVTVDDALVVGVLESVANLRRNGERLARRDRQQ
jgi:hypothetical protein